MVATERIDTVLGAYIACALWSSIAGVDGQPLDDDYGPGDVSIEARAQMRADVSDFLSLIDREAVDVSAWTDEQIGHDFWLTRNGHGAGFWDRGHGEAGERLTALCKPYGEVALYTHLGQVYAA